MMTMGGLDVPRPSPSPSPSPAPQRADLAVHARWVVPVEPEGTVLNDYCVVVRRGVIVALVPSRDAELLWDAAEVVHLDNHVVTAGLVNAHTHAGMTLMRGYAEDLPLAEWLTTAVWPTEARVVSPGFVRVGTELAIAEMIKSGTTCFFEMYFHHDVACEVVLRTGIRSLMGLTLLDFPTAYAKDFDDYLAKALSTIERFKGHPLLQFALSPHAPYTVCDENLLRTWKEARRLGLPVHTHLHETEMETMHSEAGEESMARHRSDQLCRPLANFKRMGITGPRLIGAHMAHLVDAEVEMLARDGAHIVHCPESNMKLVAGFCPVHKLLKAGANVALGTDSACSNNDLSMLGEMRTAALVGKVVAGTGNALSGGTALRMATMNGARAAGQADVFGSLEVGKSADMIAIELKGPQHRPIYHVLTHLTYNAEASAVTDVWVAGKRLLRDRQLTTINEEELLRKVDAWQAIIADQSASVPDHLYH